jgi:esterase/lipase
MLDEYALHTHKKRICFVFMAGFVSHKNSLLDIKHTIEALGYSAVITHFWGDKEVKDFSKLTIQDCMDGISELIESLTPHYDSVVGIGVSISGALLIEHTKTHNGLDAVVSIGTPFKVKNKWLIDIGFALYPLVKFLMKFSQKYSSPDMQPLLASKTVVNYLYKDFPKHLSDVTVPVLFLQGEEDIVADGSVLEEYLKELGSMHKELVFVPHADHVLNYNADVIISRTLQFIAKDVADER